LHLCWYSRMQKSFFFFWNFLIIFWRHISSAILLGFKNFFYCWICTQVRIALQKNICEKLLPCFLGGQNGGQGSNGRANDGWVFLQVLNLHIWRRNNWLLKFCFLLLLSIEDENVLQQKKLEFLLSFFLNKYKCWRGVGLGCGRKHFLNQISSPHIWGNNDWVWAFFFFMDRHLS
jgi:hypothetical protein